MKNKIRIVKDVCPEHNGVRSVASAYSSGRQELWLSQDEVGEKTKLARRWPESILWNRVQNDALGRWFLPMLPRLWNLNLIYRRIAEDDIKSTKYALSSIQKIIKVNSSSYYF